jgi:adenylate cyclase, class 1
VATHDVPANMNMNQAIDFSDGISRRELGIIKERFLGLHRQRLQRIHDDLREPQQTFLKLLPLYLHVNHPLLPGYVSSETPCGISDYQPDASTLRMAKAHGRGYEYKKHALTRFSIHGLYVMGSVGSIAYSRRSDLDFWVCYDPQMPPDQLQLLTKKLTILEQHAAKYGLEVHFFPMNLDLFRNGETQALSKESSGSMQHILLLEEFYRTAVLIAGRYPIWWLVPPSREVEYTDICKHLFDNRFVDPSESLDFGGIGEMPPDEFFGSARWQLYKGINSPYKAVLKILLTEAYAREYPEINWICLDIKTAVYSGDYDIDRLDSYLLMYQRVESYLLQHREHLRLELARRCFYFKVDRPLTRKSAHSRKSKQQQLLESTVRSWGWDDAVLSILDNRRNWKVRDVMQERDNLVRELSRSYRVLVDFTREFGQGATIDPNELKLLGRKLYAALERRPGKIEGINPGISNNLSEAALSLHREVQFSHSWVLYLGEVSPAEATQVTPLRQAQSLVELLAWCYLNGVISRETHLHCHYGDKPSKSELQQLRNSLEGLFHDQSALKAPIRALSKQPRLQHCSLFINSACDPLPHRSDGGSRLISDRFDPLSYSASRFLLINSVEQLISTSWGEVLSFNYSGADGFMESLVKYLRLSISVDPDRHPPPVDCFCFNEAHGHAIARRVNDVFSFIGHIYGPDGPGRNSRYILPLGQIHYMIHRDNEKYVWLALESFHHVLRVLSQPVSEFSPVVPDPQAFSETPLPAICAKREKGRIQLFFHLTRGCVELYIMDELGCIFFQKLEDIDPKFFLARQHRFLHSIQQRRSLTSTQSMEFLLQEPPRYFQLKKNSDDRWENKQILPPEASTQEDFLQLKLMGNPDDDNDASVVLFCGEQEFSTALYGDAVFHALARHVLGLRKSRHEYPIYLTGVEPPTIDNSEEWRTIQLLQYKQRIERQLNAALKSIVAES